MGHLNVFILQKSKDLLLRSSQSLYELSQVVTNWLNKGVTLCKNKEK